MRLIDRIYFKDIVSDLKVKDVRFLPGEHDASLDEGAAYKEFFGEAHLNQGFASMRCSSVCFFLRFGELGSIVMTSSCLCDRKSRLSSPTRVPDVNLNAEP